jgi:uracil-DNA glycosylase
MTKIVLIGEAWGARENLFEHAFVGPSGVELAKMLHEAELAPALPYDKPSEFEMIAFWKMLKADYNIAVANVFNQQPPDNDIEFFFTDAKAGLTDLPPMGRNTYLKPKFLHHLTNLWTKIAEENPNLIIAFGNTACWAVLGETKISLLRGTLKMSPRLGIKVLPTYHPAAVLRQWNLRPVVVADLEKAEREAVTKTIRRIERWLTVNPTLSEIENWLQRPAEFYAVDIENPKIAYPGRKPVYLSGQIAMIGFARSPNDALVIPFFDETKPGGSYWPSALHEVAAWRLAQQALASPIPKIFQNGIFDITHLLRQGFRPAACQNDTMLLHHALYPEMLKSLGFLGSVYSDEIAWKTMSGRGNNLKRDE